MANTEPQVAFKLDIPTLDELRAALIRDYAQSTEQLAHIELTQIERTKQKLPRYADENEKQCAHRISQYRFQIEKLLRHFSVDEKLVKRAEETAHAAAQLEHCMKQPVTAAKIVELIKSVELTILEGDEITQAVQAQLV